MRRSAATLTLPCDNHSVRRLAVTMLTEAGVDFRTSMALAGHSSPQVHQRYVRLTKKTTQTPEAAVAAFGAGIGPRTWTNQGGESDDGKAQAQENPGLDGGADGTRPG